MTHKIVGNDHARAMAWAKDKWPDMAPDHDWGPFTTLHLERGLDITAVVVYNQYILATNIDIHVATLDRGRWLNRSFLHAVFAYPFEQLGVRRVTARIGANNPKARKFLESLGFTHEGTIRQGWEADVDLLVFGLLKNECRFLRDEYSGKTVCPRAA